MSILNQKNSGIQPNLSKVMFIVLCILCMFLIGCGSKKKSSRNRRIKPIEIQQETIEHADKSETPDIIQDRSRDIIAEKPKPIITDDKPVGSDQRITSSTAFAEPSGNEDTRTIKQEEVFAAAEQVARELMPSRMPNRSVGSSSGNTGVAQTAEQDNSGEQVIVPVLNEPGMADELISVNFDQADIRTVIKAIGDITGMNFVIDDGVRGTVTVMSPTKIRLGDVYDVLESILEVQGFAAVPAGNLVKILPKSKALKNNSRVQIGSDPEQIIESDTVLTQIMPLKYADATEVSEIIKPLMAADAQISTYPRTNSLIITDTSSNIRHIAEVIQELDITGSQEQVTVLPLEFASAQVLSEQISQIMQKSRISGGQSSRSRGVSGADSGGKILADVRTNSLIVVANAQETEAICGFIKKLDIQRPVGADNVHVKYLQNAMAKEVAESLTAALTNLKISGAIEGTQPVQITADESTNALVIAASAQDYELIEGIVKKLDIVREQVLVEMLIMEVSEDGLKEIGVDWATLDKSVDGSARGFAATSFGPRVDFANGNLEGLAIGLWKGAGANLNIGTMLHALEKRTGVNILSTPHILTLNHNKAKIIVGDNRPFVTESRITETTDFITPTVIKTYEYKDVGIQLEITPHISQGGLIRLEVDSEFTKLIESSSSTNADTPTTSKRQAETVVSMETGSTIVIGGLIRDDTVTVRKKVPLLGDMPALGGMFRFKRDQIEKTNLLIFITPYIIGNQEDLERATERKKKEMITITKEIEKSKDK